MTDPILSPGEWEALIFGVNDQLRPFVTRLALHLGHLKPCAPADCPVCGTRAEAPGQLRLGVS